ncbi:MAG: hypothetical protein HC846_00645 [Blastocatellia bacterium]|nr:hypothetical protein [Blastocatellia bacterium]
MSCIVCHSIESVNGQGIGGYVFGQPALIQKKTAQRLCKLPTSKFSMMFPDTNGQ